jgi:ribose/xylose/arabinose/galactoside ABC-type transport system permease subunit/ABC-type multidrug transport system ATPase subunit
MKKTTGKERRSFSDLLNTLRNRLIQIVQIKELGIFIPFLILFLGVGFVRPEFFSKINLINIASDVSFLLLPALGVTIVMLTGGIDISVGYVSSLAGIVTGLLLVKGVSIPLAITVGLLAGMLIGFLNGFFVVKFHIPAIIVTLGTMQTARGIGILITEGEPLYPFPQAYLNLGRGALGGIPITVFISVVILGLIYILLHHTRYGYWLSALGGNREVARRAGLPIVRLEWSVYIISSGLAALMGILFSTLLATAKPSLGAYWEMRSIIATVIGGTSLFGGIVTVIGTFFGATIMGMLNDVLVILRVGQYWEDIVVGGLIIAAVGFDAYRRKITFIPEKMKRLFQKEAKIERPDLRLVLEGAGIDQSKTKMETSGDGKLVLELKNISKFYGYVQALDNVSFELHRNEVVAIVGDNGAGKSTLLKIATGAEAPSEGEIIIRGQKVEFREPRDAASQGIIALHQDLSLINTEDIASNLFLGREPLKWKIWVDRKKMLNGTQKMLDGLKIKIPSAKTAVQYLSGGQRQGVAIGRAVSQGASILFLDEPTAALGVEESQRVLTLVEELKAIGCSIVIISHNLLHVFAIADRIFVLRSAKNAGIFKKGDTSPDEIVAAITGAKMIETIK